MPYRRTPNSTPSIRRALVAARDQYAATSVAAERAISVEQFAHLDPAQANNLLNRFLKAETGVDAALAAQLGATRELNASAETLRTFVSHFHQVLDLGIERGVFNPEVRAWYGRDGAATSIPNLDGLD